MTEQQRHSQMAVFLHDRRSRRREALDQLILAYAPKRRERDQEMIEKWRAYLAETA